MTKKKYSFWDAALDITGALLVPATFGTSMVLSPTARGLVGNVLGGGSDDSSTQQLLEQQKLQNEQYKLQMEERRAELERLRKEREKDEQKVKQNNEEIERLRLIINDPNKSDEDKNRARSRMIVLEDENRKLKAKLGELEKDIKKIEDDKPPAPTTPSIPWKFPKLSAYDKLLAGAILVLIIYFLFLREDKKR